MVDFLVRSFNSHGRASDSLFHPTRFWISRQTERFWFTFEDLSSSYRSQRITQELWRLVAFVLTSASFKLFQAMFIEEGKLIGAVVVSSSFCWDSGIFFEGSVKTTVTTDLLVTNNSLLYGLTFLVSQADMVFKYSLLSQMIWIWDMGLN